MSEDKARDAMSETEGIRLAQARAILARVLAGRSTLRNAAVALGMSAEQLPADRVGRRLAVYRAYVGAAVRTASPLVSRVCQPHGVDLDGLLLKLAAILDTETTTLNPATGDIIELAICQVTVDARGRIVEIGDVRDWLEDPGYPLPPEIVRLTGLTDADLAGRQIDDAAVLGMLADADLIVAHNAVFDAAWIERRYPAIAVKPWCCSLKDIDWHGLGIESRQLGPLLGEVAGFFNMRHRADADVAALVALLGTVLPSGRTACSEMILSAQRPTVRLLAEGAPFEVKDRLRARGYRWDHKRRRWWIEVTSHGADDERAWLATEAKCRNPMLREITWHQRHRA